MNQKELIDGLRAEADGCRDQDGPDSSSAVLFESAADVLEARVPAQDSIEAAKQHQSHVVAHGAVSGCSCAICLVARSKETKIMNDLTPIVWVDCETTGLDRDEDLMLEVAVVVTDGALNELGSFSEVVHQDRALAVRMMERVVLQMHTKSGLLAELAVTSPSSSIVEIEQRILEFVAEHGALGAPMAGSNIGFDRGFLSLWMPSLNDHALHYRSIDVSTVKEIARRYAPAVLEAAPQKRNSHRALDDIRESIAELRHYRDAGLFTPTMTAAFAAQEV